MGLVHFKIIHTKIIFCRSQWPRGLRRGSAAARLPGLWVRIPQGRAYVYCMLSLQCTAFVSGSGVPRNFVRGGGFSKNEVEDRGQRERGSAGGSPLVWGSGSSCNLVQEISFRIVKFS